MSLKVSYSDYLELKKELTLDCDIYDRIDTILAKPRTFYFESEFKLWVAFAWATAFGCAKAVTAGRLRGQELAEMYALDRDIFELIGNVECEYLQTTGSLAPKEVLLTRLESLTGDEYAKVIASTLYSSSKYLFALTYNCNVEPQLQEEAKRHYIKK